jgi:cysteine synthase A
VDERPGALASIGNTPLVRLARLAGPGAAEIWVKLEAANPTGSYKDRMALAMIEGAERRGTLRPGQTVVEYTGGSTGSSLAFVCAVKGYPLRIVTSIHPDLIPSMMRRAAAIVDEDGAFPTDQFHNRDALDGYRVIGEEVLEQLPGPIHAWCAYVGVGGCFVGTGEALRARWPELARVVVEPAESAVLSGEAAGTHRIEGGGVGFVPPLLAPDSYDRVETVATEDAFAMARQAAVVEGVWTGPSGGANLVVAVRLARELGPGHRVVTVQPDSGLKYLNGELYR